MFLFYLQKNEPSGFYKISNHSVTMEELKIALLQILPETTLEKNLKKGLDYCRKAKDQGADIALFPEMWSIGYDMRKSITEL